VSAQPAVAAAEGRSARRAASADEAATEQQRPRPLCITRLMTL
jgi:hypothetical protein